MANTTVTKVDSAYAPTGAMGQKYLASGVHVSMRLWSDEAPSREGTDESSRRDYEVVGYALRGRAELEIEGQTIEIGPGDSYVVPKGALHKYTVIEPFSAVEATTPPAFVHARDERHSSAPPASTTRATRPEHAVKEILVAVDFSARSNVGLQLAVDLARSLNATVRVLHVCAPSVLLGTAAGELFPAEDSALLERSAREELARLIMEFGDRGVAMAEVVKTGEVADSILEVATELKADMLVLCTRGRRGLTHALLGSVAEKVVREASCPVVTLHA